MSTKSPKSFHLIYFILSPFFTLIYYLNNYKKPKAKNVMWLFTIFYGATFSIGAESTGSDINRYIDEIVYLNTKIFDLNGILEYFYLSGEFDVLRIFLAFFVSSFTDNGYYLIIVYGIIFGYFYSRNMFYVLECLEGKTKRFTRILLFCMFLIVPIWFINGFRFWTATHVFLFGLLPYLLEEKKKSLIWCFLTPFLIHYSFFVAIVPLVIYLLLGNKLKFYFIFFIVTLFFSNIDISQLNKLIINYTPEILIERSDSYLNNEAVEVYRNSGLVDSRVWYANYYLESLRWVLVVFLTYLYSVYLNSKLNKSKQKYEVFLGFTFLFMSVANILSTIPSGGRFLSLANLLAIIYIILIFQNYRNTKTLRGLSIVAIPFLIFFVVVAVRLSLYSMSVVSVFGNPLVAIITFGDNLSLNDIIKGL